MKVAAIIQARMSSRRFPGKVLHPVCGRALLESLVSRLSKACELDAIGLATSLSADDDPLAAFAAARGLACYRGPLDDVAARFIGAAESFAVPAFVRVNGDSPFLDPALVDRGVALFRSGSWDLATNVFPRSFPKGQSVEVISLEALRRVMAASNDVQDREHVTMAFYRDAAHFRIANFSSARPWPDLQLSVDTPEDLARLERMLEGTSDSRDIDLDGLLDRAEALAAKGAA